MLPQVVGEMVQAGSQMVHAADAQVRQAAAAQVFESIDANGDGVIDRNEFREAFHAAGGLPGLRSLSPPPPGKPLAENFAVLEIPPARGPKKGKMKTMKKAAKAKKAGASAKKMSANKAAKVRAGVVRPTTAVRSSSAGTRPRSNSPMSKLQRAHQQWLESDVASLRRKQETSQRRALSSKKHTEDMLSALRTGAT